MIVLQFVFQIFLDHIYRSCLSSCIGTLWLSVNMVMFLKLSKSCFIKLQIARRLLGKILIDLRNTREEALSVAELKSNQDQESTLAKSEEDGEYQSKFFIKSEDTRRASTTSDLSIDQDDDDDKETKYRLDPKYMLELFYSCVNFSSGITEYCSI